MNAHWRITATFVAIGLLAACSAPPLPPPPDAVILTAIDASEFPGAADLLPVLEPLAKDRRWRTGDEMLFGLRLDDGGRQRRWLMHIRVADEQLPFSTWLAERLLDAPRSPAGSLSLVLTKNTPEGKTEHSFSTRVAAVQIRVHDAEGKLLGESTAELGRDLMAAGLLPPARGHLALPIAERSARIAELRSRMDDMNLYGPPIGALLLIGMLLEGDPVLSPILWEVAEKPWLAVLLGFGVNLSLGPRFEETIVANPAVGPLRDYAPSWVLPVRLSVNDTPVVDANLLVTAADAPVSITGGLLGCEAWRPGRPDLRLRVVLLGARRGPPRLPSRSR